VAFAAALGEHLATLLAAGDTGAARVAVDALSRLLALTADGAQVHDLDVERLRRGR
jgi:hypothetical protein